MNDGTTLEPGSSGFEVPTGAPASETVPALTILYHPELRRIGDRLLLSELRHGRELRLARGEPAFSPPGHGRGEPLGDPHLSRRALSFSATDETGGVQLDVGSTSTRVIADGTVVEASRVFSAPEVDDGVVLELAGAVVLLLHHFRSSVPEPPRFGLVGDSSALVQVRLEIERVADLRVPVMLRGETGTGKELVASAIHRASGLDGPFLAVNLGAIPASLASSELFGAARGAFTGAARRQAGYFERARGGSLFLDEIGEAPPEIQVRLLRVLESGEIQPVGDQKPRPIDVRLLAATDADLEAAAESGDFRAALLHRLGGYEIHLPPLRHRRDDVGRLLLHFLRRELEAIGEAERLDASTADPWLPAPLVARLARLAWPGNVRQLRNVARQLVIASRGQPRLEIGPVVERLLSPPKKPAASRGPQLEPERIMTRRKLSEISGDELDAALRRARWDLKATAETLGISRTSLYALLEKLPGFRAPSQIEDEEIVRCHEDQGGDLDAMIERLGISRRTLKRRLNELGLGAPTGPEAS